jgi:Zn-dependent protease
LFNIFSKEGLISFLYVLPALLISLAIHEFAHAFVAYKLGDKSQKAMGRLTLDPFAHIDLFGFICIALVGFGWGKPVMVDDRNFKDKLKGNMLVSLAGPASNLVLAVIFTIVLKIIFISGISGTLGSILTTMFVNAIVLNVVFAVFNMLPIPPFDGSKVLMYFLPYKYKDIMYTLERYSFYIIIIFLVTNLGSAIVTPIVNFIIGLLNCII